MAAIAKSTSVCSLKWLTCVLGPGPKGLDINFRLKLAFCQTFAFIWATVPPVIVDPLLFHHVRYGSRKYPMAFYYIISGSIVLLVSTFIAMSKTTRMWAVLIPFVVVLLGALPFFTPELPHGNLVIVGLIWLVIAILTLWAKTYAITVGGKAKFESGEIDNASKIEYVKEMAFFWRTSLIGLAGSFIALTISWLSLTTNLNKETVGGHQDEAFVLDGMHIAGLLLCALILLICPLWEAMKKHRTVAELFFEIKPPTE